MKLESEQYALDWATPLNALRNHDAVSALLYTTAEKSINNNNFTVSYNPSKSSAKVAKITAAYDDEDESRDNSASSGNRQSHNKHRGSGESAESGDNAAKASSTSPDSSSRQQEFLRKVASGIQG